MAIAAEPIWPLGGQASPVAGADWLDWAKPPAWAADAACKEHPELDFVPSAGANLAPLRTVCQCNVNRGITSSCQGARMTEGG